MTKAKLTGKAALYLRSSKDRSDVSIDAQRRELVKLAAERGLAIVAEFADVVESGKDENRPGFQDLIGALRSPSRDWTTLLLLDTSRLARRRHIAVLFEHEAERSGIKVIYRTVPETDAITEMLLRSILQAMDEWHSLTSRRKGLAGMAENVRKGFRAGGRAPIGYQLEEVSTGAIREGQAVKKTRLILSDDAPRVGAYLKARARSVSRAVAVRELGKRMEPSSLVGIEWNALTYAGHTVWNVHNDRDSEGHYRGGSKRRPRSEWVMQRNTHPALITEEEAEQLIAKLESSPVRNNRRSSATYLLSGLLRTPDGNPWHGDKGGKYYRVKTGRSLLVEQVDRAILGTVMSDLTSADFVAEALQVTKDLLGQDHSVEIENLKKKDEGIEKQISQFLDLAREMETQGPILRKVDGLERERRRIGAEISRLEADDQRAAEATSLNEASVSKMLANLANELQEYDRGSLKDFLSTVLDRVHLDPEAMSCQLHYRISVPRRNKLASPRGFEPRLPP
jgi:site-specific DNA recombinase